jgi:transposase
MEAYPLRIRKRIIELYAQGWKTKRIADALGACRAGVRRVRQHLRQRGSLEPITAGRGRKPKLGVESQRRLRELVETKPDATLTELRDGLGIDVHIATIDRWLGRLGISLKKSRSRPASRIGRT